MELSTYRGFFEGVLMIYYWSSIEEVAGVCLAHSYSRTAKLIELKSNIIVAHTGVGFMYVTCY